MDEKLTDTCIYRIANEQSLLTFAIAAEETEYVHILECSVFVISGSHKGISAKDMWHEVKQVMNLLSDFIDLCFFEMSMFGVITIKLFILYSGCVAPYKLSLCSKHFITQVLEVSFISFSFCCVPDFFLSVIMTMINTWLSLNTTLSSYFKIKESYLLDCIY